MNDNVSSKGMFFDIDKGMFLNIRDEDYFNEEDFKVLFVGMEFD